MTVSISERHTALAQKQAILAGYSNLNEYLEDTIERAEVQTEDEQEIIAAVKEGLEDAAAGRVQPYETVLLELANKYNIQSLSE